MDEADDALVASQPQVPHYLGILGHPRRQPLRAEATPLRRLQQRKTHAAGGQQLFLLRHLGVGLQTRDDGDDQRRM